jgi:hypothetical protein
VKQQNFAMGNATLRQERILALRQYQQLPPLINFGKSIVTFAHI